MIPISKFFLAIATMGSLTFLARGGDADKIAVRPLAFKSADPTLGFKIGGLSKVAVLKDLAAVEAVFSKEDAKALVTGVDFAKEQIVLVSWTTSGPPEGSLKHELKGTGADRRLIF